eukprot:CAMPEP_0115639910 /NCGR_PEP_ID=MMETSP0272-20121206/35509_1 /TAXON_ID=71861 /ORGANISM="Scrippsiella trochoidea, Strain CCMP3099" /LENGTH=69 /DNA_ID=CAMNT_0003077123 /DNA_START=290 /DNA_END=497 /DNA_ORIENTATION=-
MNRKGSMVVDMSCTEQGVRHHELNHWALVAFPTSTTLQQNALAPSLCALTTIDLAGGVLAAVPVAVLLT